MDHHCPWINNCVGWGNQAHFTSFLVFTVLGCIHATVIQSCCLYRAINRNYYLNNRIGPIVSFNLYGLVFCVFTLGLSLGAAIAVGMLLYFQVNYFLSILFLQKSKSSYTFFNNVTMSFTARDYWCVPGHSNGSEPPWKASWYFNLQKILRLVNFYFWKDNILSQKQYGLTNFMAWASISPRVLNCKFGWVIHHLKALLVL